MDIEWRDPTIEDRTELQRQLREVAWTLATRIGAPSDLDPTSKAAHLARLRGLSLLTEALDEAAAIEAAAAGQRGADYPDLGDAWRVTRQSARKRWPGVVPDRSRWFGSLLRWDRTPDGWSTRYAGREFEIVKLNRRDAHGRGVRPGWHFTTHPDDPGNAGPIGPALGATYLLAKQAAEVWLTTEAADRRPYDDAPSVLLALSAGGAAFGEHLAAYPDPDQRRIIVRSNRTLDPVATITPHFITPAVDVDQIRITWAPALADGTTLDATHTWRDAARAVTHAL